jgi:hypothetical protein
MRNLFLYFICIVCSINNSFSQDENTNSLLVNGSLNIDSFYQKKDDFIIVSGIHSFDSISKNDLIKKVKHWGGTKFVNLKEVLVSETEDQLVFNYITNSFYVQNKVLGKIYKQPIAWYIRLVVQFKENRIRCIFYDDGNVSMPPSEYGPGLSARTYRIQNYFKEKDGVMVESNKMFINGLLSIRNSINYDFISIKEDILKGDSKSEDW